MLANPAGAMAALPPSIVFIAGRQQCPQIQDTTAPFAHHGSMHLPKILRLYLKARSGRPGLRSVALVAALLRRGRAPGSAKPPGIGSGKCTPVLGKQSHEGLKLLASLALD